MTDLLQRFLDRLESEFGPQYVVSIERYSVEEDRSIRHFIHILLVPDDELYPVAWRGWEIASEVYGDESTPFLLTALTPEASWEHYSQALIAKGRKPPVTLPVTPAVAGTGFGPIVTAPPTALGCHEEASPGAVRGIQEPAWFASLVSSLVTAPDGGLTIALPTPTPDRPSDPPSNFALAA